MTKAKGSLLAKKKGALFPYRLQPVWELLPYRNRSATVP